MTVTEISKREDMREWTSAMRRGNKTIALVPTMGSLHAGHLALVSRAKQLCDVVVVSIYVNPTQFSANEDFGTYPRDLKADIAKLETVGADAVFSPDNLYDESHESWVEVVNLQARLEGKSRPHFFRGVATIITKLINIVSPHVILFGKKDYQQSRLISKMISDLDLPVRMETVPIHRLEDGLACSSRNVYLTSQQHTQALALSRGLRLAESLVGDGVRSGSELEARVRESILGSGGVIDYVELSYSDSLERAETLDRLCVLSVAVFYGRVRLIDNIELEP